MIFLLETVAFLQLVLIPGTLVIGLVRPNYGKFRSLLLIPGLSLLVNYIYAAAALSCGIFTWWSARIFTVLTWVLICLVFRREIKGFFTGNIWKPFQEYFTSAGNNIRQMYLEMERPGKVLLSVSLFSCAMGLIWFLVELLECRGKVFTTWDSALSWNYWATFWMRQEIPRNLSYYPQMIPLNWANAYLIIGRELQFVTKFAVMFFPLLAGLFFADYGLRKRSIPMLLSVPLLAVFFVNVDFQSHGAELDTVIIYCSTALLFTVYYLKDAGNKRDFYRQLLVIALLLAVAGSVKQAGLFLIPAAILIGGTAINQKRKELDIPAGKFARYIASLLAVTILLTAPFYIFTASRISSGTDASNVEFVTKKIYRGKSHLDRFVCSCRFFMLKLQAGQENVSSAKWVELDKSRHWGYTIYKLYDKQIIPGLLMLIFNIYVLYCSWCKRRKYPGIMLCAVVFTLIWSVFFCYDLRNLALAFPWIVLMEAVAVCNFFESRIGAGSLKNLNFWQAAVAAGLLCWLFMPEVFDNDRRIRKFNTAKMQAGYPQLNTIIYEWAAADKTHRRIVTDYIYGVLLPEINNRFENCTFMDRQEFMDKFDLPSSGAVLIPRYADPSIREFVREQLEKGRLRESFSFQEYTFYEKTGSNN